MRIGPGLPIFAILVCLFVLTKTAHAVIRPDFTPANLFEKSHVVAELAISKQAKSDLVPSIQCSVTAVIKGRLLEAALSVNEGDAELVTTCATMLTEKAEPAILFIGSEKNAALHWGGRWFPLESLAKNRWRILSKDRNLDGIWNGGTARLLRAVNQVASDPRTVFPVRSQCRWKSATEIGEIEATVKSLQILHSFVDDVAYLRIETTAGVEALKLDDSKLTPLSEKALEDAEALLTSKTAKTPTWYDFDGDKKPDDLRLVDGKFTLPGWGDLSTDKSINTASSLVSGDFNQDGLVDIIVVEAKSSPRFYFNRGFGSFVRAHDLTLLNDEPLWRKGMQSIAMGDLNADGLLDVVAIDTAGSIWLLERESSVGVALGLQVVVGKSFKASEKVAVSAFEGERFLGIQWGSAGSILFFAKPNRGPLTLRFENTGGKERSQQSLVIKPGAKITLAE